MWSECNWMNNEWINIYFINYLFIHLFIYLFIYVFIYLFIYFISDMLFCLHRENSQIIYIFVWVSIW